MVVRWVAGLLLGTVERALSSDCCLLLLCWLSGTSTSIVCLLPRIFEAVNLYRSQSREAKLWLLAIARKSQTENIYPPRYAGPRSKGVCCPCRRRSKLVCENKGSIGVVLRRLFHMRDNNDHHMEKIPYPSPSFEILLHDEVYSLRDY